MNSSLVRTPSLLLSSLEKTMSTLAIKMLMSISELERGGIIMSTPEEYLFFHFTTFPVSCLCSSKTRFLLAKTFLRLGKSSLLLSQG